MTADVSWLTVGRRVLRVATRDGDPDRPPLPLCNGIGGRPELHQPAPTRWNRGAHADPGRRRRPDIMHRLIPHSQPHVYRGGHLALGVGAERLAPVVEAFPDTDLAAEGNRR